MPIFYYAGFLLLACNKDKKYEMQVIQNDVLCFCENKRFIQIQNHDTCLLKVLAD